MIQGCELANLIHYMNVSRLSSYGHYKRLIDLFEAISSTVQMVVDPEGFVIVKLIDFGKTENSVSSINCLVAVKEVATVQLTFSAAMIFPRVLTGHLRQ